MNVARLLSPETGSAHPDACDKGRLKQADLERFHETPLWFRI
jgi:hypothetical protein